MSPDEIVSAHPSITLAQVHAALAYYHEHKAEIDADIAEGERFVEELKEKHAVLEASAAPRGQEGQWHERYASTWMSVATTPSPTVFVAAAST